MAALATITKIGGRQRRGQFFEQTVRVGGATGVASAVEWIAKADIGFSTILGISGYAVLGTTDTGVNFVMNAQGTGVAADTNPGDLGVESTAALTSGLLVTVYGKI
jgi:hypothetical protein